ncbi:putative quinol monooxygenase [Gottfriedia acidiceleris]|uniref:Antibiotic biosynthesis monooxygenase n=1 Tax=Gottfriedia acidiceleris TaxID=371036 RepID=A0ABY4JFA9_9BACI|nr:putative quinol monooxygenase [Gottfriedia acidiceleris]UPM52514.1 antibiotic biosynthesis monooxygenase [Gottfriedia acidiceleris]
MDRIIVTAILRAKEHKKNDLKQELLMILPLSLAEEGCLEYRLHESSEDENTFVFYEVWENEDAFQSHIQSTHYKTYRQNIENLIEVRKVYTLNELKEKVI